MKTQGTDALNFKQAVISAARNVINCKGRARRSEFWSVRILIAFVGIVSQSLTGLLNLLTIPLEIRRLHDAGHSGWWLAARWAVDIAFVLYCFEEYKSGRSPFDFFREQGFGYEQTMAFLEKYGIALLARVVAFLTIVVFWCQDSQPFTNKWGASDKYPEGITEATEKQ